MPDNKRIRDIPTRNIDFQVDTIRVDDPTWAAGYFSPDENTITSNYRRGDDSDYHESEELLIHEQKHRDNSAAGLYEYPVSPEQAYKINMHDEISATMSELIVLRQSYIETGDISVLDGKGGFFTFYKQAVESGKLNPFSEYKEDFDKEMAFIVNGTRNAWEESFSNLYNDNSMWNAKYSSDKDGKYAEYHDRNYQRAMKIAYTIGGVDFTQYMDRDAEIPEIGKREIDFENKKNKLPKMSYQQIVEQFDIPKFNGDMSLEQYQKLIQHKLAMNKFLDSKPWYRSSDKEYIDGICFDKMLYEDPTRDDLRPYMKESLDNYRNSFIEAQNNVDQSIVNAVVNAVAKEYARRGDELPKANDEVYNNAVNQVYTYHTELKGDVNYKGNVCLRETLVNEDLLKTKLPQYAQSVQDRTGWELTMYNYMTAVGMSDEEASAQAKSLARENKLLGGYACFVGAPIASAWNKCKNLFSSDIEKDEKKEVKNEIINEINKEAPKYRKWEDKDGSRVSEVQYRELPDLTKDVIKKPTKSYSESMQKGHAKIAEMRAKRAAGHEEISSSTRDESPMAARLRELRFEKSQRTSGSITPTRINALHLANLLKGSVNG
ncbi:MAG: hypothetical protein IJZ59_01985 [Alphaproteobacteria bacterium]|nr:hypothetical protein [Alphaproteobacteria bacterium]